MQTVLIATDAFLPSLGGIESHVLSLVSELAERGFHPIILTSVTNKELCRAQVDGRMEFVRSQSEGRFKVMYFVAGRIGGWSFVVPTLIRSTFDMLERLDIRLVHCHSTYSPIALMVALCATARGIPCVYTNHSAVKPSFWACFFGRFQSFVYRRCDKVVCVSQHCLDMQNKLCGVSGNSCVIYNPIITELTMEEDRPHGIKLNTLTDSLSGTSSPEYLYNSNSNGLSPNHEREVAHILWVARLSVKKGISAFAAIAEHLKNRNMVFTAVCTHAHKVANIIRKSGFTGRIQIIPLSDALESNPSAIKCHSIMVCPMIPPNEFKKHISRFNALLMTSYTESFCMVAAEALAEGVPVVGYKCEGLFEMYSRASQELATSCLTSSLVKTVQDTLKKENIEEVAILLEKNIVEPSQKLARLREQTRKNINNLYSVNKFMEQIVTLYNSLIHPFDPTSPLRKDKPVLEWSWVWVICLGIVYIIRSRRVLVE